MFVNAIEIATKFTRPIHTIERNYGSNVVHRGAATLFFVNSDGWALTCRHVANIFSISEKLMGKYKEFQEEIARRKGEKKTAKQLRKELERKYEYNKKTVVELRPRFFNCIKGDLKLSAVLHKSIDIALLKFESEELMCDTFPVFPKDTSGLKQGKFLCRLGFPFAEFENFAYDEKTDTIIWTETGRKNTPRFPIEGMVTRRLRDVSGNVSGFEMSTPGLRGQSGGPAFDQEGKVWGMQSQTGHLDLNFDVDQEVVRNGLPKRVYDSAFMHVGYCVHVDILKSFMRDHDVNFDEA